MFANKYIYGCILVYMHMCAYIYIAFGGTSAAAPLAAGIYALVLEAKYIHMCIYMSIYIYIYRCTYMCVYI